MSTGSPRITVRLTQEMLDEVLVELDKQIANDGWAWQDLSGFVQNAIGYYLTKRKSSRNHRRPKLPRDADGWPLVRVSLTEDSE